MRSTVILMMFLAATLPPTAVAAEGEAVVTHALAMHGEPKYGPSFEHFD